MATEFPDASVPSHWWPIAVGKYAAEGLRDGRWGPVGAANVVRCLRVWPARFEAAGYRRPIRARDISAEMLAGWSADPWGPGHDTRGPGRLAPGTAFQALWILRGFLRRHRVRLAERNGLWRMKRGDATRRRWYDSATIDRLYALSRTDEERYSVAITGWAGLRRREACGGLAVGGVNLDMANPTILVARKGGRKQLLPVARSVANAIRPLVAAREGSPEAPVYPKSYSAFGSDLVRLGRRAGLPGLSAHDLRRTFGRMLYYERHVDLNTIRVLYSHASVEMTAYYIGASHDELRSAVEKIDTPTAEAG